MDPATTKLLVQLGTYGPLGVMVVLEFILLLRKDKELKEARVCCAQEVAAERKRNDELQGKLIELSTASIKSDTLHTEAINANTRVLDSIDRRLA